MSQTSTLKGQCIVEFLDTGSLIFFDVDCVVALRVVGVSSSQWETSVAWGLGVVMTIYLIVGVSGAHLNPVITIALWLFTCFDKCRVIPLIVSQVAGASCTAALVYGLYYNLFFDFEQTHYITRGSAESVDLAGTFSTYPNPHINFVRAFVVEMVITATLVGLILVLMDDGNGAPRGPLAPLLIGLLIAVIGVSMGPLTGFAMNPARDFGSKVFVWLAGQGNVAFTSGRDIPYFLALLFSPTVDAIVGAFAYRKLIGRHLSCDICVVEEKETTTPSERKASLQYDYGTIKHD